MASLLSGDKMQENLKALLEKVNNDKDNPEEGKKVKNGKVSHSSSFKESH